RPASLVLVPGLLACADARREVSADSATSYAAASVPRMAEAVVQLSRAPASPAMATAPAASDRKLIESAELRIEVRNARAALQSADSAATLIGALLVDSHVSRNADGRQDATFTVNVPAARFAHLVAGLRRLGRSEEHTS